MATLQATSQVSCFVSGFPVVAALWATRFAQRSGYRDCSAKSSVSFVEFAQQLFVQMSPRSLFDGATLGGYPLLLRLPFGPRSRFRRLRHVPDLWPTRADVSLSWLCVRVHERLALFVGHKIAGTTRCRTITLSKRDL